MTLARPLFADNTQAVLAEYQRLTGASPDAARTQFHAAIQAIKGEMRAGRTVTISKFGRFHVQVRQPRKARNPRTGAIIEIPERRYPRFASADSFKEEMNPPR